LKEKCIALKRKAPICSFWRVQKFLYRNAPLMLYEPEQYENQKIGKVVLCKASMLPNNKSARHVFFDPIDVEYFIQRYETTLIQKNRV